MLKLNLVRCWNWTKCYAFPQTGARPFPNTVVLTHCPLADAWKSVKFHFKRQSLPSYLLHCLWNCTGMLTYNLESTLVQVMACRHQATSHYLRQSWHRSMSPYGITRPQWEMQVTIGLCSGLVLKRQQIINWTNDGPARWWPDSSPFIYKDAVLLVKEFHLTTVLSSLWEALYSIRYCALICANNIQSSLDTEGKILQVWYFSFFCWQYFFSLVIPLKSSVLPLEVADSCALHHINNTPTRHYDGARPSAATIYLPSVFTSLHVK